MKSYYVYILECSDGSYYTGITSDLEERIYQHHAGIHKGYTHKRRPVRLLWRQEFTDPDSAIAFEKRIKGWSRLKKEALIQKSPELLPELSKNYTEFGNLEERLRQAQPDKKIVRDRIKPIDKCHTELAEVLRVTVRPLTKDDYPACAKIYEEGIATGIATFETSVPDWEQWDQKFLSACRLIAQVEDNIVGWIALTPFSSREVYKGVAEVSLYVAGNSRGKGVGKLLLQECIIQSEKEGFWTLQAKIFPQNMSSLQLFENCGFRAVGLREKLGMRDGRWYDNVLMEKRSGR